MSLTNTIFFYIKTFELHNTQCHHCLTNIHFHCSLDYYTSIVFIKFKCTDYEYVRKGIATHFVLRMIRTHSNL